MDINMLSKIALPITNVKILVTVEEDPKERKNLRIVEHKLFQVFSFP
jgi:hypothetical protein